MSLFHDIIGSFDDYCSDIIIRLQSIIFHHESDQKKYDKNLLQYLIYVNMIIQKLKPSVKTVMSINSILNFKSMK